VVRLLAELIENATIFSPKDSPVRVSAQELSSGGVLIEIGDSGVGISDSRLAEMNERLDNPPVIDVSVSRHMGLFAVARLAERHGVRIRLRAGSPQGLTALVWLPDNLTERGTNPYGGWAQRLAAQAGPQARRTTGRHSMVMRAFADAQSTSDPLLNAGGDPLLNAGGDLLDPVGARAQATAGTWETVPAAQSRGPNWFQDQQGAAPGTAADDGMPARRDAWAEGREAAQIIADPIVGESTAAGLPVRLPRANLIPGSAAAGRQAGGRLTGNPAGSRETQAAGAPRRPRSAETARNRLSGFQQGARRAESQTPRTGEGAER